GRPPAYTAPARTTPWEVINHDTDQRRDTAGPGCQQPGDGQGTHPAADRLRGRRRPDAPALTADVTAGVGSRPRRQPGRAMAAAGRGRAGADAPGDRPSLRRVRAPQGRTPHAAAAAARRGASVRPPGPRPGARPA